jgi:hypothetical protein
LLHSSPPEVSLPIVDIKHHLPLHHYLTGLEMAVPHTVTSSCIEWDRQELMEIITKATTRCRDLPDVACGLDHDVQGDVEPDYPAQLEEVEQVNHVAAY